MDDSKIDIGMYLKDRRVQYAVIVVIALTLISGIFLIAYTVQPMNPSGNKYNANNTILSNATSVNNNKIDNNQVINSQEIRFIVVGDPHVKSSSTGSDRGNDRLVKVIKFADSSNVDFVVFLGDIADDGKNKTYVIAKNIISNSTKPYYTVAGNHDVKSGSTNFETYFGSMEHLENVKGYQLIFPGIYFEGETKLHWSFNFSKANISEPTLVFMHGPTVEPPKDINSCNWGPDFFGYGQSMQPELNKFSSLIAEYTGHVHYNTDQTISGVRYVTVNGLVDKAGGCDNEGPSPYVGYSRIKNGNADYVLVDYNGQFKDPFPGK